MKEAEKDEAILTFRRSVIRLVSKVSSSINSQRKRPKKSGEREGKIALKDLRKELQKSHRRKAVRTEEARARRRRSRKSETHLFRRTCQRIEVTIKENFKRKRNLSDQLNKNNKNILIQRGKPTISRKRNRRGCTDGATKENSQNTKQRNARRRKRTRTRQQRDKMNELSWKQRARIRISVFLLINFVI